MNRTHSSYLPCGLSRLSLSPLALCALFACSTPTDPTGAGSGAISKTEHAPSSPHDAGARSPEGGRALVDASAASSEPSCEAAWLWHGSPEEPAGILQCGMWQDIPVVGLPASCQGLGRGHYQTASCDAGTCGCPSGYVLEDGSCESTPECDRHEDCGPGRLCVCASRTELEWVLRVNEC